MKAGCAVVAALAFSLPAAAAAGPAPAVPAAEPPAKKTIAVSATQAAQILMKVGKLDDAKKVLNADLNAKPDDPEALFLLGTIAMAQKDYDAAIADYRRILVNQPNVERVRLELARAFFLNGDYDNAELQFRRARAGDVPDAVKANIDRYLAAVNRLKVWTFNFSIALAPDTNENAATSANQVNIYGLPFTLNSNARKKSGIGVTADFGAEWSPLLTNTIKARIGADAYRTDYSGGQYDDMTLSAHAGPQFLFGGWDFSVLATGFDRWFGNKPYVKGAGGRVAADIGLTSALQIGTIVGVQQVAYHRNTPQSGPLYSVQARTNYTVSPSIAFQLQAGFNEQDTAASYYSYSSYWFGGGYQEDLPFGFSVNVQPTYFVTHYNGPLAGFGVTRSDHTITLHLDVLNRRFDYDGFTPKFSYTFTEQQSNVPLYAYTRSQFNIGLTTEF